MKKRTLISCLLLAAATSISAQQKEFPSLTGPYLGKKLPEVMPETGFFTKIIIDYMSGLK